MTDGILLRETLNDADVELYSVCVFVFVCVCVCVCVCVRARARVRACVRACIKWKRRTEQSARRHHCTRRAQHAAHDTPRAFPHSRARPPTAAERPP